MLNLDTHMVVAVLSGDLTESEHDLVSIEPLSVSSIVLWELAKLVQLRRLALAMDAPEFREFLRHVVIFPITLAIARKSTDLDFRSDPADEIIAATSLIEQAPLLTRDKKMRRSRVVPIAEV